MSTLVTRNNGGYQYLPAGLPYSRGVIAAPGHQIIHATFQRPLPYVQGIEAAVNHLKGQGRPVIALCAIELRSPKPFTMQGFLDFNVGYVALLDKLGIAIDGKSPLARTNVAPEHEAPVEPVLYAFSYTVPAQNAPISFVSSGNGDIGDDGIIRPGDISAEGLRVKARFVQDALESAVRDFGISWQAATRVNIYTAHPLAVKLLDISAGTGLHGAHWYHSRPPIEGLEYEADVRSVWREEWL